MKILAISDLHGEIDALEAFKAKVQEEDPATIVFTGDIVRDGARYEEWSSAKREGRVPRRDLQEILSEEHNDLMAYEHFFRALSEVKRRSFVIPGNLDAPLDIFLQAALNREAIARNIHIIHNRVTSKFITGQAREHFVCGFGGEINQKDSETHFVLQFSRPQVMYAAEHFAAFPNPKVLLLHTPPKLLHENGCEVVDEMIDTLRPSHVFCGQVNDLQGEKTVGTALTVCPGSMQSGEYAIIETLTNKVHYKKLEAGVGAYR